MTKVICAFVLIVIGIAILAALGHGLILAFSASIWLGIIVLIVEPAPLVIGLVYWIWGVDLAMKFMQWING